MRSTEEMPPEPLALMNFNIVVSWCSILSSKSHREVFAPRHCAFRSIQLRRTVFRHEDGVHCLIVQSYKLLNCAHICEFSNLKSGPWLVRVYRVMPRYLLSTFLLVLNRMFVPDYIVYTLSALLFLGRGDVVAGLDTIVYCLVNPARPRRLREVGTTDVERESSDGEEAEIVSESEGESGEESGDDVDFEEEEKKKK